MQTIELLSEEESRRPFWEQYWQLKAALAKTETILRALGVTDFPASREPCAQVAANRGPDTPIPSQPVPPVNVRSSEGARKSQNYLVREAAKHIAKGITRGAIIDYIKSNYPGRDPDPDSVSALISEIKKEDNWKLVEKGIGGRPSVYDLND